METSWVTAQKVQAERAADNDQNNDITLPNAADWIALASLRNSKTKSYNHVLDSAAAITLPNTMAEWLKQIGYREVIIKVKYTKLLSSEMPSDKTLQQASNYLGRGYIVFLLVNVDLVDDAVIHTSRKADHWVVLLSAIITGQDAVKMSVFTWGGTKQVPEQGVLSVDEVHKGYFGFVAAIK